MIRSDGLIDICREYNLKKYSSASSVVDGVKQRLSKDRKFCNRVKILSDKLSKSQKLVLSSQGGRWTFIKTKKSTLSSPFTP